MISGIEVASSRQPREGFPRDRAAWPGPELWGSALFDAVRSHPEQCRGGASLPFGTGRHLGEEPVILFGTEPGEPGCCATNLSPDRAWPTLNLFPPADPVQTKLRLRRGLHATEHTRLHFAERRR
jgi:hypothetical protein